MPTQKHLVIMVKEPKLGKVKTRLGKEIGAVKATQFYRTAAQTLIRRLSSDPRWQCWLQISPDNEAAIPPAWKKNCKTLFQGRGDLGHRMMKPMHELPPGPVVLIGSDIPAVRPHHIARAFRRLGNNHLVFGPAEDGGFWLVGQKRTRRVIKLFGKVRWSSPHALTDSVKGHQWVMTDTLSDVDNQADFEKGQSRKW